MPADWTKGYVTEVEYTRNFYSELAPAHLAFSALARATHAPDIAEPFSYFELGCGQGLSSIVFAACYPHAQFFANDFNPAHVSHARGLATQAGLENVTFLESGFADLAGETLPDFDFIVMHGVLSWVSAEDRAAITGFIRRKLKPGGIVYVSYNSHPGFTAMLPIRRLMTEHAAGQRGPIATRVRAAQALVARLRETNAAFFTAAPSALARIDMPQAADPVYLAHEYFNAHWEVFHFPDVAAEMAGAKLSFLGSANLVEAFEPYVVGTERMALLNEQTDPILREMVKDLIVNQGFRKDLYVRGLSRLTAPQQVEGLRQTRVALTVPREHVAMRFGVTGGELALDAEIYAPMLDALAQGPCTMAELVAASGRTTAAQAQELFSCVTTMAAFGQLAAVPADAHDRARFHAVYRLNAALFDRTQAGEPVALLASPVLGAAIQANQLEQLMIRAAEAHGTAEPAEVQRLMGMFGALYLQDGQAVTDGTELLAALGPTTGAFNTDRLAYLRMIGISTGPLASA